MSEWQPIETAPKDGTRIILFRNGHMVFGKWDDDKYGKKQRPYWTHDQERSFGKLDARECPPTDWMPPPSPPTDTADEPA